MSDFEILELDEAEKNSSRKVRDLIIDSGEFSDACALDDHFNISVEENYIH